MCLDTIWCAIFLRAKSIGLLPISDFAAEVILFFPGKHFGLLARLCKGDSVWLEFNKGAERHQLEEVWSHDFRLCKPTPFVIAECKEVIARIIDKVDMCS